MRRLSLFAAFASLLVASLGPGGAVAAKEGSDGKGSNRAAESAVARWLEENPSIIWNGRRLTGFAWTPPHPPWYRRAPAEKRADSLPLPS